MNNMNTMKFVTRLLKEFPRFVSTMKPDDLQPFMIFGDFGIYIRDSIDGDELDKNELMEIFVFLNEMGESDDEEVHNLLTVGVLEIITDNSKALKIAREFLKGEALTDLNLITKFWFEK